ncbi:MAG: amidohydrolase, partial [Mycobacteriales bacterium]
MSIVDAHHHLVEPAARDYPWITGDYAPLLRRWSVDDLRTVAHPLSVDRAILVQTVADAAETREFLDAAA